MASTRTTPRATSVTRARNQSASGGSHSFDSRGRLPGPAGSSAGDETDGADQSKSLKWSQERRLQFIDFRLQWERRLNRRDLTTFFKISVPQASMDIALYTELARGNLTYDNSSRMYLASPQFSPLYATSGPRQYLSQLLALEREVLSPQQSFVDSRPVVASVPLPSRHIDRDTLATILRAIGERRMVEVQYQSITRDELPTRSISPHAFGYDGLRWHIRAYCHLRRGFRDFVVGRILKVGSSRPSDIDSTDDVEWQKEIELVLVPDERLSKPQRYGVEVDYGMKNGRASLKCRQAMLFYTLRSLNFDSNGKPRRGERQLVIANLEQIKAFLPKPGQA